MGEFETLRAGGVLMLKRCTKLNCTVPGAPSQPPDRLGGRSSSDCPCKRPAHAARTTAAVITRIWIMKGIL